MDQLQRRLELQIILETVLGSPNVYFQPLENVKMNYPAIVYKVDYSTSEFAGNKPYFVEQRYQVTLISRDPEHTSREKLVMLPKCLHNQNYVRDSLNHDVYSLYY